MGATVEGNLAAAFFDSVYDSLPAVVLLAKLHGAEIVKPLSELDNSYGLLRCSVGRGIDREGIACRDKPIAGRVKIRIYQIIRALIIVEIVAPL